MNMPQIDLLPIRPAVASDNATELNVLIRITPPQPEAEPSRPALNLGIVLDRSGSMAEGKKMEHARQAAVFGVEQLLESDRVSVTIFDEVVETIVANTQAKNKSMILSALRTVQPRGSTALHAGWAAGAEQVLNHRLGQGLNRVLLLSDGMANVGVTAPAAIADEVGKRSAQGVTTTTIGVGDDYNEDLLEAMARAGDGNYYYVENPVQLADIFQTELRGLVANCGRAVRMLLEPQHGVEVVDVLNDFERAKDGEWLLPNLTAGMALDIIVRLKVPVCSNVTELLRVRLSWEPPGQSERSSTMKLLILPAVPLSEWNGLPENAAVAEQMGLLQAARLKLQASACLAQGDIERTRQALSCSADLIRSLEPSASTESELEELAELSSMLDEGSFSKMIKGAKFQRWRRSRGQAKE